MFLCCILSHFLTSCAVCVSQHLQVSERNSSKVFVELLRGRDGRDGLPGRDGPRGPPGPPGGVVYVRWGRSICPCTAGTQLVYSGIAGGTLYSHKGGGANYLCMPKDPDYNSNLTYTPRRQYHGEIYGAEYEWTTNSAHHNHNVPCAVCRVTSRTTILMIPAKSFCPPSWTREYYGYLMTESQVHHRTMYECVDREMEHLAGGAGSTDGVLFHHSEIRCHKGLPCPPYVDHKELNCVVCTM